MNINIHLQVFISIDFKCNFICFQLKNSGLHGLFRRTSGQCDTMHSCEHLLIMPTICPNLNTHQKVCVSAISTHPYISIILTDPTI